jgi:hypothetical protein
VGLFEKNELVRLLEELTKRMQAVRALLASGDPHGALGAIDEARRALTGPLLTTVDRVDGGTVVALLGRERAGVYADLGRLEAQAREATGDTAAARRVEARADEITRAL